MSGSLTMRPRFQQLLALFLSCVALFCSPAPALAESAAEFYSQYQNDVAGIPLPACFGQTTALQPAQAQAILLEHNRARAGQGFFPPSAQPLPSVSWDCGLAAVGQKWADQSKGTQGHSPRDWRKREFGQSIGENLSWAAGTSPTQVDVANGAQGWTDERVDYDHGSNSCSGVCGHYTQQIWRESTLVGCGAYLGAQTINGRTYPHGYFLSCTYYCAGNVNGDHPLDTHPDWYCS